MRLDHSRHRGVERNIGERFGEQFFLLGGIGDDDFRLLTFSSVTFRVQRLTEFATIAIQRIRLETEFPTEAIARADVGNGRIIRKVDRLRDRAGNERLRRRHHADVTFRLDEARAEISAAIRAIKHRKMLVLQERRAFDCLCAAHDAIDCINLLLVQTKRTQAVESSVLLGTISIDSNCGKHFNWHRPCGECKADFEHCRKAVLNRDELLV